jgi:hypothetical protein
VKEGLVKFGDFFTCLSKDDPDPVTLSKPEDGVVFYVLGLRKGKSKTIDGNLESWQFDDPEAPDDAWTTYTYTVVLPDHDEVVPYTFLLSRSSKSAAQQINTVLKINGGQKPSYEIPFRATAVKRPHTNGSYYVIQAGPAKVSDKDREKHQLVVASIIEMLGDTPPATEPTEAPAI